MRDKKTIAVFASGRGSNFQAILDNIGTGFIPATVGLCVTNNPDAGVLSVAKKNQIPYRVFIPREYPDANAYNAAILDELRSRGIDFIILAGYLKMIGRRIVENFENRIINIHPALLPSFGGKGMYGHHVHEAAFQRGVKLSGATVHLVNSEYDAGPIVMQESVDISAAASADEIAAMVLKIEHKIFPIAVKLLVEERLQVSGQRVIITGDTR